MIDHVNQNTPAFFSAFFQTPSGGINDWPLNPRLLLCRYIYIYMEVSQVMGVPLVIHFFIGCSMKPTSELGIPISPSCAYRPASTPWRMQRATAASSWTNTLLPSGQGEANQWQMPRATAGDLVVCTYSIIYISYIYISYHIYICISYIYIYHIYIYIIYIYISYIYIIYIYISYIYIIYIYIIYIYHIYIYIYHIHTYIYIYHIHTYIYIYISYIHIYIYIYHIYHIYI